MEKSLVSQVEEWKVNNQHRLIECKIQHCNFITVEACMGRQKNGGSVVMTDEGESVGTSLMEAAYVGCKGCERWKGYDRRKRGGRGHRESARPVIMTNNSAEIFAKRKIESLSRPPERSLDPPMKLADYIKKNSPDFY